MKETELQSVSLRVSPAVIADADALVVGLTDSPEARVSGRWGRSAVLRLALEEGLKVLAKRAKAGGGR